MTTIQIRPKMFGQYAEIPFNQANFSDIQIYAGSKGGGSMIAYFYKDGRKVTATDTVTIPFAADDDITVDELIMDVSDMTWLFDVTQNVLFKPINFNANSVMVGFEDVSVAGYPIYFNGAILKYRGLSS